MANTPINLYRLKGKAKDFIIYAEKFTSSSVERIYANNDIFSQLLESIPPSIRVNYHDDIPFGNKKIVPLK